MGALGRRVPETWTHVERFPLSALIADPTHELVIPPKSEKSLGLPWWWKQHDQGQEGSCVGFGCSAMMSVTNRLQRLKATGQDITYRYEPRWLYQQAQAVDEWPETPPEEGTSVRAGCDILRDVGHRRVQRGVAGEPLAIHGISAVNRWATTVDEMRAAIYAGLAVAIGVSWYQAFFLPYEKDGEHWISIPAGNQVAGGHCVSIFRMSDRRQAFRFQNSWGASYGPTWIGYDTMTRLLHEQGEACVVVDR